VDKVSKRKASEETIHPRKKLMMVSISCSTIKPLEKEAVRSISNLHQNIPSTSAAIFCSVASF
jgi:hypothetical protein